MSTTLLGTKPFLTLYLKVARSCKRRFCRLDRLARLRRLEYSTEYVLHTILRAHSCTLSTFLASEALQKCHKRGQYVKYGNIEDLYKSNFASVGIRFLNLERTPALWLAFIRSSLMCLLNTRRSSMLTPRGLMSAVRSMTCALIVVLREQNLPQSKKWRHSGLTMKDHHITRATAFKNQSTIPKATFIEIGVNQKRKTEKTKRKKKRIEGKKKGYVTGSETGAIGSTRLHLTTTTLRIIDNSVRKVLNL